MSNSTTTLLDATGAPIHGAEQSTAHVLDSAGQAVQVAKPATDVLGEVTEAVRQRPLAAVLVGIGFGLLIGRLTA